MASICSELAGLPLAIELAAARLRMLSPEQVAARLAEQQDFLTHGGRSRPDRQQTMRATLDWSHHLLAPDEQIVFRRLSIFAGGFTLDAAEQVVEGDGVDRAVVADTIERLVSRSLVAVDHDRAEPRLHMLEPVRQYAAARLREAGNRDRVVRRHLEWVVSLAAKAGIGFLCEQGRWSARLRDEQDNVRQAMETALAGVDPEAALRIAAALGYPWFTMGQPDARAWVVRALEAAPGAPDRIRAPALLGAGTLASNALDYDRALAHLREVLELFRRVSGRRGEEWVLVAIGRAAQDIDVDSRPAAAWFEDALRIFREVGDPVGIGTVLGLLAEEQFKAGDVEGAASRATEAFDVGTRSGILQVVVVSQWVLGMLAAIRGQHDDVGRLFEEAAAANKQAGDRWQLALILTTAAHVALFRGDDIRALGPLRQALRLARDSGSGERMIHGVELAAHVVHQRGRAREMAMLVGAVEEVNQRLPRRMELMRALPWPVGVGQSMSEGGFEALASAVSAEFDEHRVAGRSLSLERAADLALRVLDEELALAAAAAAGGSEAAGEVPSIKSRGGRSQAFRER